MAITDKYDLETYAYSVTDKSGIATANIEKLDDHIHSRMMGTYGESIDEYEAVYTKSDGKLWLAQADGSAQPCMGLAIESGIADEVKRIQIAGPITNTSWAWASIGQPVYLDPATPGALTQTPPGSNAQIVGIAQSATTIFLMPAYTSYTNRSYVIGGSYNGVPGDGVVIVRHKPIVSIQFPAGLTGTGSNFYGKTAATAETVFSLKKNGVGFGTLTIAALGTSATIAVASATSFTTSDEFTLENQATADATFADLGFAIVGLKT